MTQKIYFTESKTGRVRIEDQFGNRHTIIDESGNQYDRLTVLRFVGMTDSAQAIFLCECECGTRTEVPGNSLRTHNTSSCGCYSRDLTRQRNHEHREEKHSRFRNLAGCKQKHGRLTAIKLFGFDKDFRHAQWECRCECGNSVIVRRGAFLAETTQSCGCLKIEFETNRFGAANPNFRHGLRVKARPAA